MDCSHFVYATIARLSGDSQRPVPEDDVARALSAVEDETGLSPDSPEYMSALRELESLTMIEVIKVGEGVAYKPTGLGVIVNAGHDIPEDLLPQSVSVEEKH
jgi:hypothetical protein